MVQELATTRGREVSQGDGSGIPHRAAIYRPNADIYEDDESIYLGIDMPGVEASDVDVTLEHGVLTIHGRVHREHPSGYQLAYAEYNEGDFERAFTLSEDIDRDRIAASCKNGVLQLQLPKADSAKVRKVEVKTA